MSGKFEEAKGNVKQAAGDLTGNDDLKSEGKGDEIAGKVKQAAETAKDKVEDLVDKVRGKD